MNSLHRLVRESLTTERESIRMALEKGDFPNFSECVFVLVARKHFNEGKKCFLRWRGSRQVTKCPSYNVFQVGDL